MSIHDELGLACTGSDTESLGHYRRALRGLQCYVGDPVADIDAAIALRPDFVMARLLRAYLHLLGTEPAGIAVARAEVDAARQLPANERERAHAEAVDAIVNGHWHHAGRVLEDVAIDHPRDLLALQAGHLVDFYVGNARMLRDRIARALPEWSRDMPGYHVLIGMHAFGLEECADYARAEVEGRAAVELERRDGWAWHAVAHVMEMQGRERDGIAWLRQDTEAWSADSFFRVHNWWHLALYHLELGEIDEVLQLYDGPIRGARSTEVLNLIDASAMLWRLHLRGIDVGVRWESLADDWWPLATVGSYAFNDVHAVMAFVGARRFDAVEAVIEAQRSAMAGQDDNVAFTRDVGHPLTLALRDFGAGRYGDCVRRIRDVREIAHRFGGSNAQRSVLDLTLLEAALRGERVALARALCAERLGSRPRSPLTRQYVARTMPLREAA